MPLSHLSESGGFGGGDAGPDRGGVLSKGAF